jgi:glycosyltransferase involved in cell wall biosynthesis
MKKFNICIFHIEFAFSGGAEKVVFKHIDFLRKKGYGVTCYTSYVDRENVYPDIIDNYPIKQIIPEFLNSYLTHELIILLTTVLLPFYILRFRNFDFFIAENQPAPFWAYLSAKFYQKKYLVYINWPAAPVTPRNVDKEAGLYSQVHSLVKILLKLAYPVIKVIDKMSVLKADAILANGSYVQNICKKLYKTNIVNCPAGTDLPLTFNNYQKRQTGNIQINSFTINKPYLLMTNRHFPKKRFEFGLYALQALKKEGIKINMIISGNETEYTMHMKKLAHQLHIEKELYFTGLTNENKLNVLYNNALVYIYSAPEEDYGMGVVEANAYGLPVVAWDYAGPSKIVINNKTGFLAIPYSQDSFNKSVSKTVSLSENNYETMGLAARKIVKNNYTWDKHFLTLANVINEILNNP